MKKDFAQFLIKAPHLDAKAGRISFQYAFDDAYDFEEIIDFGKSFDESALELQNAIELLAVAVGISYYKAFIPPQITIDFPLSTNALTFFREMYFHGLGEFAYRNQVNLEGRLNFSSPKKQSNSQALSLTHKNAVLIGGGKDSLTSLEIIRKMDEPVTLFAVNPAKPILDCAKQSGLPLIAIQRKIDPKLFDLNEEGAYNGHVPITGIISLVTACAAIIHDFDTIILSNERSASEGNTTHHGVEVNHQYSKSLGFEKAMAQIITNEVSPSISYFSLLRPLSELFIAQIFARNTAYDSVFTSCNKAFKIKDKSDQRWCKNCPKCRFVYIALATAMPEDRLIEIFGGNMLDDPAQLEGYKELIGMEDTHKPWECVGEIQESAAAIVYLYDKAGYQDRIIIKTLAPILMKTGEDFDDLIKQMLTPSREHHMPPQYLKALYDSLER